MKSISLQKEHILTSKILMSTFLSLAMLLTSHVCHAETRKAVLFIRNTNENELKGQFCKTSNCKDIATIKTDTREFANGNTFVRFIDSTSQNNITILSPEVLNSNQFMELLIKIRIAKTDYAQSIQLYIPNNLMSIQVVDEFGKKMISEDLTRNLLASAGLQKINHKNLQVMQFKKSGSSEKTIVVDQGLNSELAKEIAKNLDLSLFNRASY